MTRSADAIVASVTSDQRLLLQTALLDHDGAAKAWEKWRAAVSFDDMDGASQRLIPMIARRIGTLARHDPVAPVVKGMYRHTWGANRLLWKRSRPVLQALQDAGVPFVLLKGVALLPVYALDWGARPMYDVDVLVRPDDLATSLAVLDAQGWAAESGMTTAWIAARAVHHSHSWGFEHPDGGRLDLHWHVLWSSVGRRADQEFWAGAQRWEIDGLAAQRLHEADLLFHVLVHSATGETAPALQWIADVVLLTRRLTGGGVRAAVGDRLAELCRRHGLLSTTLESLRAVEQLIPGQVVILLGRLAHERPTILEVMRRSGGGATDAPAPAQVLWMLARFWAGGGGLRGGMAGLLQDRLHLGVVSRPVLAGLYAASGRSNLVARLERRLVGTFVKVAAPPSATIGAGARLDFTDPAMLDQYGGPGWGLTAAGGATSRGAEARLRLPLLPDLRPGAVYIECEVVAPLGPTVVDIRANETTVAQTTASPEPALVRFTVPTAVAGRFDVLELSFRRPSPRPWRASPLGLQLRLMTIHRHPPAGKVAG